ncbi:MAG: triose-phosphate isomerase [Candidatus Pacebacteria bacterium]|nr:triose-phosphate isomerase [Candidatus Paceibacterota bacterium]
MQKKKIIVGNWKMNPESGKLAEALYKNIIKTKTSSKVDVVICPPFVYLEKLKKISKKIPLGVQNISHKDKGAFTGEVSGNMVYDLGARYVILGHSERRAMGEEDEVINQKIKIALAGGLNPILCVGEKKRDDNHDYFNVIKNQIEKDFNGLNKNSISNVIVAYEPVWAIGKDAVREATPEEFREVAVFIKKVLNDKFGVNLIKDIRIIYGGSVNPKNAQDFIISGEADGFLVGRDSLDAKKFTKIIEITEKVN